MIIHAPAKINLTLEILGRRPDGYHDLVSVMQAVSLHDTLRIEPARDITLKGGSVDAPPTADNLVLRAAHAINAAAGGGHGADITLTKRIPVGAGLGGGSSDAAATLLGLNAFWGTGLSRDELMDIAAGIGSDVPFFLGTRTALVEGRGERLTDIPPLPIVWFVLAKPAASLFTADVYRDYANHHNSPSRAGAASHRLRDAISAGMNAGEAAAIVGAHVCNDLQPAALRLCGRIAGIRARMSDAGALGTLVCGSGSAAFGVAADEAGARRILTALDGVAAWSAIARTIALPLKAAEEEAAP